MTLPFLQAYGNQSTADLIALEGTYRIDSLVLAFEQGLQAKPAPSPQESVILAVEALEREVNNGGFAQFFTNASGEFTAIVEGALRAINCPRTADIARDAIAALGAEGTADAASVADAVAADTIADILGACDRRYFATGEPIADRLFAWIKANKAHIHVGAALAP